MGIDNNVASRLVLRALVEEKAGIRSKKKVDILFDKIQCKGVILYI